MPKRLAFIQSLLNKHVPAGSELTEATAHLHSILEEIEVADFKLIKYTKENEIIIRMLEANAADLEDQKQELKELNRILISKQKELNDQNKQLQKAKKKADDAVKAKEDFLSVISHEIRTPLNAIIGISYLLAGTTKPTNEQKHVETLKHASEHLLTLVSDVLDYHKLKSHKVKLANSSFPLQEVIQKTFALFETKALEKKLYYQLTIAPLVPSWVMGDAARLSQILSNLLSNAIKFTQKGSVQLKVNFLHQCSNKAKIEFRVADTGIGISPEKQPHIFDAFEQETNETYEQFGGSGLGLHIVEYLLALHKTSATLQSKPGQGTTISFEVGYETTAQCTQNHHLPSTETLKNLTVLLVEDDAFNIQVQKSVLEAWNLHVTVAENGITALELCGKKTFDFILMDINLPDIDGLELSEILRLKTNTEHTPIIAFTAHQAEEILPKILAAGMNHLVTKPFHPQKLLQALLNFAPSNKLH